MEVELPGRTWILIWSIVFGAIAVFLWLVFEGAMGNVETRYYHTDVPGSIEIPHLKAGRYYIYQEFDKSRDSKEDLRPAGFERLAFTVTPIGGGRPLTLKVTDSPSRFVIRRMVCEAALQFDVTTAGGYKVAAEYDSGQQGGTYRIAIGQPYYIKAAWNFVLGCLILIVAGAIVTWLIFKDQPRFSIPADEEPAANA